MKKHFNGLTPAEAERLALLLEELGETSQVIGKILRHGYESYSPLDPKRETNRQMLVRELGDVLAAVQLMRSACDVTKLGLDRAKEDKLTRVGKYLHHNDV